MFGKCVAALGALLLLGACRERKHSDPGAPQASSPSPSVSAPSKDTAVLGKAMPGKAVVVDGKTTGYSLLSDGSLLRRASRRGEVCPSRVPRLDAKCISKAPTRRPSEACTADADCGEKAHGQCDRAGMEAGCRCHYGCVSDSECGDSQICVCEDPVGYCAESECGREGCGGKACLASPPYVDVWRHGPFRCAALPN